MDKYESFAHDFNQSFSEDNKLDVNLKPERNFKKRPNELHELEFNHSLSGFRMDDH